MRDLDFLRDDHHAPIAYDDSRKGFRLTDPTFKLAPVELTQREVFTFSIARKLLERFEGTPLEMDMRSVLAKIAESLQGSVSRNTRTAGARGRPVAFRTRELWESEDSGGGVIRSGNPFADWRARH